MKTYSAKEHELDKTWFVLDLEGIPVGRAAAKVASVLRGKHRPEYTPHADAGDFVVVVNADKVALSGKKWTQKIYYHHTGYPGGIRGITAERLLARKPEELFRTAVRGMLPKNPLGRKMLQKLKVYAGAEHPHAAQKPEPLGL
jgi:large subunit ribosomal protein L13